MLAVTEADIIYSPTFKLCPHFSSYSLETGFTSILIFLNPDFVK
nr:hypothetical protein [Paeniclostridium sordellii]